MNHGGQLIEFLRALRAINSNFTKLVRGIDLVANEKLVFKLFIALDDCRELLSKKYQISLKLHNRHCTNNKKKRAQSC